MRRPPEDVRVWFLLDVALFVVTLGFYMPWWFWRQNKVLRDTFPKLGLWGNAWALSIDGLVASLSRTLLGEASPQGAAIASSVGILLFMFGAAIFAFNLRSASLSVGVWPPIMAWFFVGGLTIAFLGTEIGHVFPNVVFRSAVGALLLAEVVVFYLIHHDIRRLMGRFAGILNRVSMFGGRQRRAMFAHIESRIPVLADTVDLDDSHANPIAKPSAAVSPKL